MKNTISIFSKFGLIAFSLGFSALFFACDKSNNDFPEIPFGKNGKIVYHREKHTFDVLVNDSVILKDVNAAFKLGDKSVYLTQYTQAEWTDKTISDSLGSGREYKLRYTKADLPDVEQRFRTFSDQPFFTTQIILSGKNLSTNYIAPLADGEVAIKRAYKLNTLFVPYDNDAWIRYATKTIDTIHQNTSAEVGAIYNDSTRDGLIVGSLQHTLWKSGVTTTNDSTTIKISAFAGYTEQAVTRDSIPHGSVIGDTISSPELFVGFFKDWREGMETYAKTNRKVEKPFIFDWTNPTPVGWNSWGVIQGNLNYDNATQVVDFFADSIPQFREGNTAFIDLDSFWDNMVKGGFCGDFKKLKVFADYCKSKNLQPGVYWAPFTDWGYHSGPDREAEGSEFTFGEMWTKVGKGYFDFDGARALDPTHPGTLKRIDYVIGKLKSCGFKMIKIDFLGHAAAESTGFYDRNITTGMQAYKVGMEHLITALNGEMLVYAAISPNLATGRYVHMRRIACDAFKTIENTEYSLNGLNYGWWQTFVYDYIDADHVVFGNEGEAANQARLLSAAITGTLITGDDYSIPGPWRARAKELLNNKELLKVVANGVAFKPVEGATGNNTSKAFVREIKGFLYVAVFNYSHEAVQQNWPLNRLDLDPKKEYTAADIINKKDIKINKSLETDLIREEAKLYKIKL